MIDICIKLYYNLQVLEIWYRFAEHSNLKFFFRLSQTESRLPATGTVLSRLHHCG